MTPFERPLRVSFEGGIVAVGAIVLCVSSTFGGRCGLVVRAADELRAAFRSLREVQ